MEGSESANCDVSVLLPVCDGDVPDYLWKALFSVWEDQKTPATQLVVVRDGPVNPTLGAVLSNAQQRLGASMTLVELDQNVGLGAALNAGLEQCKCKYVARMDADDISFPDRFERQIAFLEESPDVDVVGSSAIEIDESGVEGVVRRVPGDHAAIFDSLWACPMIHPSVMFRRYRLIEVGGYNPTLRRRQDYELWFRAAEQGLRFANIRDPLLLYRFHRRAHKKQSPSLAWEQAMIGYRGSSRLGLARWKRFGCFVPFLRSVMPLWAQHIAYRALAPFDPRRRSPS